MAKDIHGEGGELHQTATGDEARLTTNQGVRIADNQNSLKIGARGPTLLEDFILREKITHFDHERIPERVVHARGYGAKGFFQASGDHSDLTKAAFLSDPSVKTPVFVRFSTVAGNKGSLDTARDVRGFATKFYTSEGNFDLVGNNIPVFFIQDAIKFPDLIHSVKPEQDRAFPQAQSAHDTFWDFVGLNSESIHMLMWAMSDRAIPRSYRMMEGFGVHTFRLINAEGKSTYVKWHWRPKQGSFSLVWNEALKLGGMDPDFHRRDLWDAIEAGDYPQWELAVQAFDDALADSLDYDVLDPTKLIPEEVVPLRVLGTMTLDQNVDEFFAETEQVAFCPSHLVPGMDFTNDPLLQGRLFSYLDTQLSRLGSPNFHELPVNAPRCPFANLQRGGHMRHRVSKGRVAYEPQSLEKVPREDPKTGFSSFPAKETGEHRRVRAETFADHYTQARLFYRSQTEPERRHIANAFAFELGKCDAVHVRQRMLGHLKIVDEALAEQVASALGMEGQAEDIEPAVAPRDVDPSPALSLVAKAPETLSGKKIGVLATDGTDGGLLDALKKAAEKEGAMLAVVAPARGGFTDADGKHRDADFALSGGPSVLFDAVVLAPSDDGAKQLRREKAALDFVSDAYAHLKVIGHVDAAAPLLEAGHVEEDEGVVSVASGLDAFVAAAKTYRIWDREPKVNSVG